MTSRILIVDDVPTNIQLVASILSTSNYDLSFANSGKDALSQISESTFDLILLDVMMPELDGLAVAKKLKAQERTARIPIIFLTAKSDEDSIVHGFEVGAADYLTKPFNPSELKSRVKTHLALKAHEDMLVLRNKELAEAIKVKNRILSVASHDLKNPLSAISGFSQMLSQSAVIQQDQDASEMIDFVCRAAGRMETLIKELLDTAALEMGRIQLMPRICSPHQILQVTLSEQHISAQKKNQKLTLKSRPEDKVMADPNRLKQVFENLISNAIKYSNAGAEILISSAINHKTWVLDIQDQGPGFSEADQKNMYGYFQRLSAKPTSGESSTGVGLAIVKQIIELHDGSIELKETSSAGSTFRICLPLRH